MNKFLAILAAAIMLPLLAFAEPNTYTNLTGGTPLILSKTGKPLILGSQSTDGVKLQVSGTPVAVVNSSGLTVNTGGVTISAGGLTFAAGLGSVLAPFTATPVATPVQASNYCPYGICVVPTAAANAAVFLGVDATPVPGKVFKIFNSNGTNSIRVKAAGAAKINGAGSAGNYFTLAAQTAADCYYADNVTAGCAPVAAVTPAGP